MRRKKIVKSTVYIKRLGAHKQNKTSLRRHEQSSPRKFPKMSMYSPDKGENYCVNPH